MNQMRNEDTQKQNEDNQENNKNEKMRILRNSSKGRKRIFMKKKSEMKNQEIQKQNTIKNNIQKQRQIK